MGVASGCAVAGEVSRRVYDLNEVVGGGLECSLFAILHTKRFVT